VAARAAAEHWRATGARHRHRPGARHIEVARLHAAESALAVDYRLIAGKWRHRPAAFNVHLMEMLEHVPTPPPDGRPARLLRPRRAVVSDPQPQPQSFLLAILGAEYLLWF